MIQFGDPRPGTWLKDNAILPALTIPILLGGEVVSTVELWPDVRPRSDGSAYLTVGMTVAGFAVLAEEELRTLGFRVGMRDKTA